MIRAKEILEFSDYVSGYYDQETGLYKIPGANKEMINQAIDKYIDYLDSEENKWGLTWGGGDSIDRERTRGILRDLIDERQDDIENKYMKPKIKRIL